MSYGFRPAMRVFKKLGYHICICEAWDIALSSSMMRHICNEVPRSHALEIPWLPFKHLEPLSLLYTQRNQLLSQSSLSIKF